MTPGYNSQVLSTSYVKHHSMTIKKLRRISVLEKDWLFISAS